jgi:hypothetical protein
VNTAFLLITTAWLAGAGAGPDENWADFSYVSYWSAYGGDSYTDGSFVMPCGWDGEAVSYTDGSFVMPCGWDGDGEGAPSNSDDGWDGGYGACWPAPGYNWGCQPPSHHKEHHRKHLFHHSRDEDEPCANPGWSSGYGPSFQPYYAASCGAAWDGGDDDCGKHGWFHHRSKHRHHEEDCAPPRWQPPCYPSCAFTQEPCEISFHRGHCHKPHCCCLCHHRHHKHHQPAPCSPLSYAPYADCCSVTSDGCCGPFDGWDGGCDEDCCGAEYGGPCYGVPPKLAPKPATDGAKPAAPKPPEKIGSPKSSE